MPNKRLVIKREIEAYAEGLLEIGEATNTVYPISFQLEEMKKVVAMHPGLREVLANDSINEELRTNTIKEVFAEFSDDLIQFVNFLATRHEVDLLDRVAARYDQLVQDKYDVVILDVATVVPLDDELREKIKKKFAAQFDREIVLREHLDMWLLGGANMRANGRRVDCCVATRLDKVRAELSSPVTGGER